MVIGEVGMVIWEPFVDYDSIKFHKLDRAKGSRGKFYYAEEVAAFDIETSRIAEINNSIMYVWQFSIDNRLVIMGRTWEEFRHMLDKLYERLGELRLLVYIHNLNYEMSFISSPQIYAFQNDEVFCIEAHKILRAYMYEKTFELRCSYLLTNLGLDALTRKYNCTYSKRSGAAFDYDKFRSPSTPLGRRELLYCVYDVMGLVEAIRGQLALHGDTLYTIPYTQTGYVRRRAKETMRRHHFKIQDCFPDEVLYRVLRQAFRGGNTHGNRYFVGEVISNVHGVDISSSYPAQQVLESYPVSPFKMTGALSRHRGFLERTIAEGRHAILTARFEGLRLRYRYEPVPYIPRAKCLDPWPVLRQYYMDNGRVLDTRGMPLTMSMTEIDYLIIERQYTWDHMEILEMWTASGGPMYEGLRQLNIELFREKTQLKGIPEKKLYYDRAKEQLNSIYGMSCQQPIRCPVIFDDPEHPGDFDWSFKTDRSGDPGIMLAEAKRKAFLTYQLGVYTTAHARAELQRVIDMHKDEVIYCDTDSVMYTGEIPGLADLNEEYQQRQLVAGGYADDPSGKRHYMGVFECEDDPRHGFKYHRFITHGAKKYAFEKWDKNDELHIGITVAGVPKRRGAIELEQSGGLEAFEPGFIFSADKLGVTYNNDFGTYMLPNGEAVNITRNACLYPVTYTLGYEKDYVSLLNSISAEKLDDFENRTNLV